MTALLPVPYVDPAPTAPAAIVPHGPAGDDDRLVQLWLHGRCRNTVTNYTRIWSRFRAFIGKPLAAVMLGDLVDFDQHLVAAGLAPASRGQMLAAIKSLFGFAHKTGYLTVNPAAALRLPKAPDRLAQRILPEATVQAMIGLTSKPRDRLILRVLYGCGLRASELCGLRWADVTANGSTGQFTVLGKGGKLRHVGPLPPALWTDLLALRQGAGDDAPVFMSQRGGPLDPSALWRIVKRAAQRVGVTAPSPHWLRHCCASHALDRGAPLSVVRDGLGHSSIAITSRYVHAKPDQCIAKWLAV